MRYVIVEKQQQEQQGVARWYFAGVRKDGSDVRAEWNNSHHEARRFRRRDAAERVLLDVRSMVGWDRRVEVEELH